MSKVDKAFVEKEKKGASIILMGYWNVVIGEGGDGRIVGKYTLGKRNERANPW